MENYRFELEPYTGRRSRHTCPQCGEKTEFTRYIDLETRQYVSEEVGMCNRRDKCGYHYPPRDYFRDKGDNTVLCIEKPAIRTPIRACAREVAGASYSVYDLDTVQATQTHYERNGFSLYLLSQFGNEAQDLLLRRYHIGTTKNGSTVFWLIDIEGKARNGQVIPYSSETGKRLKAMRPPVSWVHSKRPIGTIKNCLFGEHLLALEPEKPVAIVEAPKTAIIASLYYPQYVWLATCGKHGIKWTDADVCSVLQGRDVYLFPDLGYDAAARKTTGEVWKDKAKLLRKQGIQVEVVDLLEKVATKQEKEEGLDLADYLIRFNYRDFKASALPQEEVQYIEKLNPELQKRLEDIIERLDLIPL